MKGQVKGFHFYPIGPSGVHALPLDAGRNEGCHYSRYFGPSVLRAPAEQLRWPLFMIY